MKKTLLNIVLASVATAAFADTTSVNFSWASQNVPVSLTQAAVNVTVAGFNGALGTLTGVSINLTGTSVVGTATAQNQGNVNSTLSLLLIGNHTVSINGLQVVNSINATSAGLLTLPSATATLGPVSASLSGTASGGPSGWTGGTIPVLIGFAGAAAVSGTPQVQILSTPTVTSSGFGTVTYTYTATNVPEAETYVAGLALVGMAGYGFYRRSRKA